MYQRLVDLCDWIPCRQITISPLVMNGESDWVKYFLIVLKEYKAREFR